MAVNLAVTYPELYAAGAIHSGVAYGVADDPLSALCAMNDGMGKVRLPEGLDDQPRPAAPPLIVFHGDADDIVHPRNGDQITRVGHRLILGFADTSPPVLTRSEQAGDRHAYTRRIFYDQPGLPIGEQWLVHGLAHAWSGGHPAGTYTDERGPHASSEIVRFFGTFTLDRQWRGGPAIRQAVSRSGSDVVDDSLPSG
jgi:poly(3-hydroxybutyrate) depolymerase